MNITEQSRPEVTDFVAQVRALLADLEPEERRDITDGLEADLNDLVAERGGGALGDPADYARELRTAAGLAPVMGALPGKRPAGQRVNAFLDAAHVRWDKAVSGLPGTPWEFVSTLQPAWWIIRAWLALQLADLWFGRGSYNAGLSLLPSLGVWSIPAFVIALVGSIQLGRGKLWPTRHRGALSRVVLLGLNTLAIGIVPVVLTSMYTSPSYDTSASAADYRSGYNDASMQFDRAGMYVDGKWVTNIYPYDAQGHPLVGVQLFNQVGAPMNIGVQANYVEEDLAAGQTAGLYVPYPWTNGASQLRNVFPMPQRIQQDETPSANAFVEKNPPKIGKFPLASVPEVSLPGIKASRLVSTPVKR